MYIPYLLQQKAQNFLSNTEYCDIVGHKTKPVGFIPDCYDYSICVDYLSVTVPWSEFGVSRYNLSQLVSNEDAVSNKQKILSYVVHYLDEFFRHKKIPIKWLLSDEMIHKPFSDSGYWKPCKGLNYYTKGIESSYGVKINYSGTGEINNETFNIIFTGTSLRLLRFSFQLELIYKLQLMGFKATRIDTAYDIFSEVAVSNFTEVLEKGDVFGVHVDKCTLMKKPASSGGDTLYLGSRSSHKLARIYDAGYKHCKPLIDRLPFNWTRIECEFKKEKAAEVFKWISQIYVSTGKYQALYAQKLEGSHLQLDLEKGGFEILVFDGWQVDDEAWEVYFSLWRSLILSVFDLRKDKKGGGRRERCERYGFFEELVAGARRFKFVEGDTIGGNIHPVAKAIKWVRKQVASSLMGVMVHCSEFGVDFHDLIEFICWEWTGKQSDKRLDKHLKKFAEPDSIMYNPLGLDMIFGSAKADSISSGVGYEIAF